MAGSKRVRSAGERAPAAGSGSELSAVATRWHGLPELTTRSIGAGLGWRAVRAALGVAQTGSEDLGWRTLAVGLGVTHAGAGAGARVCARSLATAISPSRPGLEAGAGVWMRAAKQVELLATAPQIFTAGLAPPLERRLEIGALASFPEASLWLSRAGAPTSGGGLRAEHSGGVALSLGAARVWASLRDHPLRGGFGLEVRWAALRIATAIESHPVLDETVHLGLALHSSRP